MRTFEETHPWLKDFSVDLRKIDYITWLLLGEAASKIEHIAGVPLSRRTSSSFNNERRIGNYSYRR